MKLFKLRYIPIVLAIVATTIIAAVSAPALATGNFGPERPTKVWSPTVSGFPYVTFNSFTHVGNGIGDERDFYRGVVVGRDSVWSNPIQNVPRNSTIEAQIYIHNNADASLNASGKGIAHNVTVRVVIPKTIAQSQETIAYISASNAKPGTIYDSMKITSANNTYFGLAFQSGTAQIHEQDGKVINLTTSQTNAMLTGGLNLGDQLGCFAHVQLITFRMKVNMPNYTVTKKVGFAGQSASALVKTINAKPGEVLGWEITFTNTGQLPLSQVIILDQVPVGLTVVPGSVKLVDGNFPKGYVYPNSSIQANGRQINVNIGNSNPGIGSYIIYRTTVNASKSFACGQSILVNEVYATPQKYGTIFDKANADIDNQCTTPPVTPPTTPPNTPGTPIPGTPSQLVNTGPGNVIALFSATTVAGAIVHRLYAVRRLARSIK